MMTTIQQRATLSAHCQPALGTSVETVLDGWRNAVETSPAPQRIRAFLTIGIKQPYEFSWQDGRVIRIVSTDIFRLATSYEMELLKKCIAHGWFLVYLTGPGEPTVLHQVDIGKSSLSQEREDAVVTSELPPTMPTPATQPMDQRRVNTSWFDRSMAFFIIGAVIVGIVSVVFAHHYLSVGAATLCALVLLMGERLLQRRRRLRKKSTPFWER